MIAKKPQTPAVAQFAAAAHTAADVAGLPFPKNYDHAALVEQIAIMCAEGNNGGAWAMHYTEAQKAVWRQKATEIIARVTQALGEDK